MRRASSSTRTCSNLQLVEIVLLVVLAISIAIVSLGEETTTVVIGSKYYPYPQWWYVDAFCIGSSCSSSIGRGRRHRSISTSSPTSSSTSSSTSTSTSTLAASRPSENDRNNNKNNINDWVSYLEEVFNSSDDDDEYDGNDNNNNNNEGSGSGSSSFIGSVVDNTEAAPFQTPVTTYTNALELLDSIDEAPPNDLTAVLFFAHYCKTCHRANIPFKQLAYDEHSNSHSYDESSSLSSSTRDNAVHTRTRFLRFETSALSPNQFRSIGLDRVPFVQIYRNGICVAAFSATHTTGRTTTKMVLRPRLLENLDACKRRSLSDWSAFRKNHAREIENNKAARTRLRAELVAGYHSGSQCDGAIGIDDNANSDDYDNNERRYRSVRTLTSEAELLSLVVSENENNNNNESDNNGSIGTDESVVIMFHSHFDQSCLRAQHKFRKIADQRRQQQQQHDRRMVSSRSCTTMARIESSLLSDQTIKRLGIQRYPHIQIYRGSSDPDGRITNSSRSSSNNNNNNSAHAKTKTTKRCVASFSIPRSFLFGRMIHEALDAIDNRTPEEWADFYKHHKDEIESQQVALERIVTERNKSHHRRR